MPDNDETRSFGEEPAPVPGATEPALPPRPPEAAAESPPAASSRSSRGVLLVFLLFVLGSVGLALYARNADRGDSEPSGARLAGAGETPPAEVAEAVSVERVSGASSICTEDLDSQLERQLGRLPATSVGALQPQDVERAVARAVVLSASSRVAVLAVPLTGTGEAEEIVDDYRTSAQAHHRDTPIREISSFLGGGGSDVAETPVKDVSPCSTVTIRFGPDRRDSLVYVVGVASADGPRGGFCESFEVSYLCDEASQSDGVPEGERP